MSVLKPRSRCVYYRVSEEEFQALEGLCQAGKARSISELSRGAVRRLIEEDGNGSQNAVDERLRTLDQLIGEFRLRLGELKSMVVSRNVANRPAHDGASAAAAGKRL